MSFISQIPMCFATFKAPLNVCFSDYSTLHNFTGINFYALRSYNASTVIAFSRHDYKLYFLIAAVVVVVTAVDDDNDDVSAAVVFVVADHAAASVGNDFW